MHKLVVMGVSGCGKTTLGAGLARRLGWRFIEGDRLHPEANIAKMSAGMPLDDEDRWPFLDNVARELNDQDAGDTIVSCSALKRSYREFLRARAGNIWFVLPDVDERELVLRMKSRKGHFMPPALLASQLEAFERPQPDETVIVVPGTSALEEQIDRVIFRLVDEANLPPSH